MGPWFAKLESPSLPAYFLLLTHPGTQLQTRNCSSNAQLREMCNYSIWCTSDKTQEGNWDGEMGRGGCYRIPSRRAAQLPIWAPVPNEKTGKNVGGFVGFTQGACSKTQQSWSSRWHILTATICPTKSNSVAGFVVLALGKKKKKENLVTGKEAGKAWRSVITIWLHSVWKKREKGLVLSSWGKLWKVILFWLAIFFVFLAPQRTV